MPSRIDAAIAAVVVLPFVAEITALPWGRPARARSIARGSRPSSTFPGRLVPPLPSIREAAPAARAAPAAIRVRSVLMRAAGP